MQIFHNRPLALSCVILALCAVFGYAMPLQYKRLLLIVCTIAFILLLVLYFLKKGGRRIFLSLLCVGAAVLAFASSYIYFQVRYAHYRAYADQAVTAEGIVLERESSDTFYTTLRVSLDRINEDRERVLATLALDHASPLQVGDRFLVSAIAVDPATLVPQGAEKTFLSEGKLLYLSVKEGDRVIVQSDDASDLRVVCSKLNLRLSYGVQSAIGGEAGGIAAALLLGNRTWIDDVTTLHFRRAGVSHLLALSGLHVAILIGFAEWFLSRLRLAKAMRGVAVVLLSLVYLAVTGCQASTLRAVFMVCVCYFAVFVWSGYDAFTALCAVLAAMLTFSPYSVLSVSLWMSFLATASILIFSRLSDDWLEHSSVERLPKIVKSGIKAILGAITVGLAANLALMLYSAYVFGEISLASLPATLALSVPVTLLLILSLVLLCFPFLPLLPTLGAYLGNVMLKVAGLFSDIPNVMMPAMGAATRACLVILTAYLIILAVIKLRWRLLWLPIPILFAITVIVTQVTTLQTLHSSPVEIAAGYGELRLYTSGGDAILVNDTRGNASESFEVKQTAASNACTEIDTLVFCRYYNQATYFINRVASTAKVWKISLPQPADDRERAIAKRLEEEASRFGITVEYDAKTVLMQLEE